MRRYQALIFDLDGTLIDSAPDITAALNTAFSERGWPQLQTDYVETFIGNGPHRLIKDILDDKGIETDHDAQAAALAAYMGHYARDPVGRTQFYPHVRDDLKLLRAAGFRMGICTNKPQVLTLKILDLLGLAALFEAVIGADAVPSCKPDPGHLFAVAETMALPKGSWAYIGDTIVDRATARDAGVPFYVVPWGDGAKVNVPEAQRLARLSDLVEFAPERVDRMGRP